MANYDGDSIDTYNATTGAVLSGNFISGLNSPRSIALSGNNLFVATSGANAIAEYNATTGALINATFASQTNVYGLAVAVPEPSAWALLGVGTGALALAALRRRTVRAADASL